MLIDKVTPYATPQQLQTLQEIKDAQERLLDKIAATRKEAADAVANQNWDLNARLQHSISENLEALALTWRERDNIQRDREQAYIEHFDGDERAILADVLEIVSAIEKEDYLSWQRLQTENLQQPLKRLSLSNEKSAKKEYRDLKQLATRGFRNCYFFILSRIRVQLNALAYYGSKDGEKRAAEFAEEKAGLFYSRPRNAEANRKTTAERLQKYVATVEQSYTDLIPVAQGNAIDLMRLVLSGDVDNLPDRRKRFNRSTAVSVNTQYEQKIVSSSSPNHNITVEISDVLGLVKGSPMAKKILTKILIHHKKGSDIITFPLQELVGEEMYKSLDTARNGYNNIGRHILTSIKVYGDEKKGNKLLEGDTTVIFPKVHVKGSTCYVWLGPGVNWDFITPYHSAIPPYYFNLPNRAADLLWLIFATARQRTKEIAEQGYFSISYRSIQYNLNLPNEADTKNPKRDIKDEIEKAVEQIEEKNRENAKPLTVGADPDFSLLPQADYDAPITDFLDSGKLLVYLKGDYARSFLEISKRTEDNVKDALNRQKKIEDEAHIRARAAQIKSQNKRKN